MIWRHLSGAILLCLIAGFLAVPGRTAARLQLAAASQPIQPFGVAVGRHDDYFVADAANGRIMHYNAHGTLLGAIGHPGGKLVQRDTAGLSTPTGVAFDSKGNLFVADLGNARVAEFTQAGVYVGQIGKGGFGPGKLLGPVAVAISGKGEIYVVDAGAHTVNQFTGQGALVRRWGGYGTGVGSFDGPSAIALDAKGIVYVADTNNSRVQAFTPDGAYIAQWGRLGGHNGNLRYPTGIAVDAHGTIWVADGGNRRVVQIHHPFAFQGALDLHGVRSPSGIAVGRDNRIYVADTAGERVLTVSLNGAPGRTIGSGGHGRAQLSQPNGVAVDTAGSLYVADTNNNRIEKFSPAGAFVAAWGTQGRLHQGSEPRFLGPQAVAVDTQGNIYVADTYNNRIQKLDSQGHYQWEQRVGGQPRGIATDPAGHVFVTSYFNQRVLGFNAAGKLFTQWGGHGRSDGLFRGPSTVAVDATGKVYVADTGNGRVEVFAPLPGAARTYGYSGQFGSLGGGAGQFSRIAGVAVGADATVYAVDQQTARLQIFNPSGAQFESWPSSPSLQGLCGLALDHAGHIVLASSSQPTLGIYSPTGGLLRQLP